MPSTRTVHDLISDLIARLHRATTYSQSISMCNADYVEEFCKSTSFEKFASELVFLYHRIRWFCSSKIKRTFRTWMYFCSENRASLRDFSSRPDNFSIMSTTSTTGEFTNLPHQSNGYYLSSNVSNHKRQDITHLRLTLSLIAFRRFVSVIKTSRSSRNAYSAG